MIRPPAPAAASTAAVLLAAVALAQAGAIERSSAYAGPASEAVKAAIGSEGYAVARGDGSAAGTFWFAREISGIANGAFFGVVSFEKDASDFRGQPVKAGGYTLRYARMPMDGNHMGVAPTPEFLLLVRIVDDPDPKVIDDFDALTGLSAKVSGLNHPSPLNLARTEDRDLFPAVAINEEGHEVFFVKVRAGGAEAPIGIVITGRAEQ